MIQTSSDQRRHGSDPDTALTVQSSDG